MTMRYAATLWDLEERFWTDGMDSARTGTSDESIMIFAHPFGILQNDRTRARPEQQNPWRSIGMTNRRLERRGDIVVLTYSVSAEKADAPIHEAVCASTYLLDGDAWRRMSHNETPLPQEVRPAVAAHPLNSRRTE
ncbi:hypothetical protein QKW60_20840 [Defluviimonas aestuarii]|uniref:hypothetical protein n=1 Tax=Albidovulum aestuarii TaxID=1130726 RepID=UPI00249CBAF4|nr:hypothetical protein [Defluviimonas aestuarii]MDI3338865.1 hypothetical protein [Defluviimonas aestuarii]